MPKKIKRYENPRPQYELTFTRHLDVPDNKWQEFMSEVSRYASLRWREDVLNQIVAPCYICGKKSTCTLYMPDIWTSSKYLCKDHAGLKVEDIILLKQQQSNQ